MKNELVPQVGMQRRDFLRTSILFALPMMAGTAMAGIATGGALPATQTAYVPPTRTRGTAVLDVMNYGALGDGVHDDTSAFQAAIDALPATGGTVTVPAGIYLLDAVRSVQLRSLMLLQMDPAAKLMVKPNSVDTYDLLLADVVQDVEIAGGQIFGERDQHTGTTGESGHGIRIRGATRVTIRDIFITKCWGDGITVGPKPVYQQPFINSSDVVVSNVVCTSNRRNGLSIGNVIGMKVYDSEFSNTYGTSPQCGIDVEPSQTSAIAGYEYNDLIWIENCLIRNNARYGINVWQQSRRLTVTNCTIQGNQVCGMVARGLTGGSAITGNIICNNMSTGLFIQTGTDNVDINGNTSYSNYLKQGASTRQAAFYLTGMSSGIRKDLVIGSGTSNIRIGNNYYK